MAEFRRIKLSRSEISYLKNASFLPAELDQIMQTSLSLDDNKDVMLLSLDAAERFREEFTAQLAKTGFDSGYEPTSEGRMLEALIDRFYFARNA